MMGHGFGADLDSSILPWFPEFDATNMVVSTMPVWVRLPNLPLPFCHIKVLEDIRDTLGKFERMDLDRT